MNKLKRLPEAGRLAAGMMASNNKVLSNPNIRKLMRSRESGLDSSVSKVLGDTPDWHKSLVELRKARTDSGKLFRRTLAYQRRFGELPTDTLEGGVGSLNGALNLGVGGGIGAVGGLTSARKRADFLLDIGTTNQMNNTNKQSDCKPCSSKKMKIVTPYRETKKMNKEAAQKQMAAYMVGLAMKDGGNPKFTKAAQAIASGKPIVSVVKNTFGLSEKNAKLAAVKLVLGLKQAKDKIASSLSASVPTTTEMSTTGPPSLVSTSPLMNIGSAPTKSARYGSGLGPAPGVAAKPPGGGLGGMMGKAMGAAGGPSRSMMGGAPQQAPQQAPQKRPQQGMMGKAMGVAQSAFDSIGTPIRGIQSMLGGGQGPQTAKSMGAARNNTPTGMMGKAMDAAGRSMGGMMGGAPQQAPQQAPGQRHRSQRQAPQQAPQQVPPPHPGQLDQTSSAMPTSQSPVAQAQQQSQDMTQQPGMQAPGIQPPNMQAMQAPQQQPSPVPADPMRNIGSQSGRQDRMHHTNLTKGSNAKSAYYPEAAMLGAGIGTAYGAGNAGEGDRIGGGLRGALSGASGGLGAASGALGGGMLGGAIGNAAGLGDQGKNIATLLGLLTGGGLGGAAGAQLPGAVAGLFNEGKEKEAGVVGLVRAGIRGGSKLLSQARKAKGVGKAVSKGVSKVKKIKAPAPPKPPRNINKSTGVYPGAKGPAPPRSPVSSAPRAVAQRKHLADAARKGVNPKTGVRPGAKGPAPPRPPSSGPTKPPLPPKPPLTKADKAFNSAMDAPSHAYNAANAGKLAPAMRAPVSSVPPKPPMKLPRNTAPPRKLSTRKPLVGPNVLPGAKGPAPPAPYKPKLKPM